MKPAPGIVDCKNLPANIFDIIDAGIDLFYEEAKAELSRLLEGDAFKVAVQELNERWEPPCVVYLVGDWKKTPKGYEIDTKGKHGWAGSYQNETGDMLTIAWSRHTAMCHPTTSPYACGDLNRPGGDVLTYALAQEPGVSYH